MHIACDCGLVIAMCYVLLVLWMTTCFPIMDPVAQAMLVVCKLKIAHRGQH